MRAQSRHQSGAISISAVMLVLFMLATAIVALLVNSGSSIHDATTSEKSTAALFLAESGVERGQASIARAITQGGYTNTTCTDLLATGSVNLGRGSFAYESARSTPSTCGGWNPPCTECNFTSIGQVADVRRRIQTQIHAKVINGVMGHGSNFTLDLHVPKNGSAAFTNLAYRAAGTQSTDTSSNANVSGCTNTGGTCDIANNGWELNRTGTNNVSSMGVFSPVNLAGVYTITDTLSTNSGTLAARNFTHTGMLLSPNSSSTQIDFVGQYSRDTGSNKTASTSLVTGTLPSGWTCNLNSGTSANMSRAALADTLVYGFASWPQSNVLQLNGVTLGMHPLKQVVSLIGDQGDNIYSQLWYSWNAPFSPAPTATSASTTLNFSGSVVAPPVGTTLAVSSGTGAFDKAQFVASVSGNVMTVTSVSQGSIKVGDAVFGRYLNPASRIDTQLSGSAGSTGTYRVCQTTSTDSCAQQEAASGPVTARVGVVSQPSPTSLNVSRAPTTTLSGATVCGGVCAFFFNESGANTTFTLTNITAGDDWASGFACLKGVDPASVQVLTSTELKRTYWAEPAL